MMGPGMGMQGMGPGMGMQGMGMNHMNGMSMAMPARLFGPAPHWWTNPELMQRIGVMDDQKTKIMDVYQSSRLKLIDVTATLQKEEVNLEPLMAADQPDQPKILSQIDRVAQSRAEVEKANARMLLGIRAVLTKDQWAKLKAESNPRRGPGNGGNGPQPRPAAQPE